MHANLLRSAVLAFSLVTVQTSFAHEEHHGRCEKMHHLVKTLHLSHAQETKIKAIKDNLTTTQMKHWEEMRAVKSQINALIFTDKAVDTKKLDELIHEKTKHLTEIMKAKSMSIHEIYLILDPKQRPTLEKMHLRWEKKMEKKWESC